MTTLSKPTIEGERYRATIPDTLDLADRTELALNGLGGSLDPELDYEMYFWIRYAAQPAYMYHWAFDATNEPKLAESFPLMRIACGMWTQACSQSPQPTQCSGLTIGVSYKPSFIAFPGKGQAR